MKIDIINLTIIAVVGYIGYYIFSQNELIENQKGVIDDQYNLIETQRAYIFQVNKMLGINGQLYYYQPQPQEEDQNPLNNPI